MFLSLLLVLLYIFSITFAVKIIKNYIKKSGYHSLFYCYIFAQSLYVLPPIFDQIFGLEHYKFINELVLYSSISTILFALGGLTCSLRFTDETNISPNEYIANLKSNKDSSKIFFYSILIGTVSSILYLYQLYEILGLDPIKWFASYLSIEKGEDGFGKAQVWLMGIIAASAILIFIFQDKNKILSYSFFLLFGIIVFSLLVRGNRNFLMLCLLPILVLILMQTKNLKPGLVMLLFFGFIFSGQLIDIIRAVGIYSVFSGEQINPEVWLKGISAGEFGATIRSFDFYLNNEFKFDRLLGKSYLVDPFLNMITTLGLSFDVLSYKLAVAMSPRGVLFGYGFSPQLESILNFGFIGGPLVYFFLGFFIRLLDVIKTKNIIAFATSLYLLPIFVNMQRIDFAVVIKLSAIPIFVIFLIVILSRVRY